METLLRKGKQQAIDQTSFGSRAKNKRFTGQPAEQVPSEGLAPPLTEAKVTSLASKTVN